MEKDIHIQKSNLLRNIIIAVISLLFVIMLISIIIGGLRITSLTKEIILVNDELIEVSSRNKIDSIKSFINSKEIKNLKTKQKIINLEKNIDEILNENIDSVILNADSIELYNVQSEYERNRESLRFNN